VEKSVSVVDGNPYFATEIGHARLARDVLEFTGGKG